MSNFYGLSMTENFTEGIISTLQKMAVEEILTEDRGEEESCSNESLRGRSDVGNKKQVCNEPNEGDDALPQLNIHQETNLILSQHLLATNDEVAKVFLPTYSGEFPFEVRTPDGESPAIPTSPTATNSSNSHSSSSYWQVNSAHGPHPNTALTLHPPSGNSQHLTLHLSDEPSMENSSLPRTSPSKDPSSFLHSSLTNPSVCLSIASPRVANSLSALLSCETTSASPPIVTSPHHPTTPSSSSSSPPSDSSYTTALPFPHPHLDHFF